MLWKIFVLWINSLPCSLRGSHQAQNVCISFVQSWTKVEDVVQMLYKYFVFAGVQVVITTNIQHFHNINTTLAQRPRRWTNIIKKYRGLPYI